MHVVIHADEACLGNGQEPPTPGGYGGLVEFQGGRRQDAKTPRKGQAKERDQADLWGEPEVVIGPPQAEACDYCGCAPDTTNNRMALTSAIVALDLLAARTPGCSITFVSDSNYLILGMREWVPAWRARGWRRKGGPIENLDLWQALVSRAALHAIRWEWVRGHAGHPRNEYANALATRAAAQQLDSGGLVPSGYAAWLAGAPRTGA